jgi:hypothetical protein
MPPPPPAGRLAQLARQLAAAAPAAVKQQLVLSHGRYRHTVPPVRRHALNQTYDRIYL